jgi:hypothetical protein
MARHQPVVVRYISTNGSLLRPKFCGTLLAIVQLS